MDETKPSPDPLRVKLVDLHEGARRMIETMIEHLVMDSDMSPLIAEALSDFPAEKRKETVVELIEKGYLKGELNEDETKFRWVIWRDGAYQPL